MKKTLVMIGVSLALVGCSTAGPKIASGTRDIESYKENKIEFPKWYLEVPTEDSAIYATATEVSSDLQFALDKSLFSAKREIAFKLKNSINQQVKEYTTETNYTKSETTSKETQRLVVANSKDVNIVGTQTVRTDVIREGGRYRAFVLVRYGLDESNKIHMSYVANDRRATAKRELDTFSAEIKQGEAVSTPVR